MKKTTIACMMLPAVLLIAAATPALAEYLFLKDGSIIEGTVANETDAAVTVTHAKGGARTVPRTQLLRTLYRKDFLYRQSAKLYSGEVLDGFLVQESQDEYIFRKELFAPAERIVKKKDVIYLRKKELYTLEGKIEQEYSILDYVPSLTLRGSLIIPIKKAYLQQFAYGGGIGFNFSAIRRSGFGIGIDAGCWYLRGKGDILKKFLQGGGSSMILEELMPSLNLRFYYDFPVASWLSIAPIVSAGASYNNIAKLTMGMLPIPGFPVIVIPYTIKYKLHSFSIIAQGGIDFKFNVSKVVSIILEGRYGIIYENEDISHFVSISPGLMFRF
jgi:hypothetical protein